MSDRIDSIPGISRRVVNCLSAEGLYSVQDVLAYSATDFMRIPGLGKGGIRQLATALSSAGFELDESMRRALSEATSALDRYRPEKYLVTVTKEFWSCRDPNHRHRTIDAAVRCMDSGKGDGSRAIRWTREKSGEVTIRALSGESISSIAKSAGISSDSVSAVISKCLKSVYRENNIGSFCGKGISRHRDDADRLLPLLEKYIKGG